MYDEQSDVSYTTGGKMGRRYENMEEDNDDEFSHYQSTSKPLKSKYEIHRRSLADKQSEKQGRFFTVYPNDDPNCKHFRLPFSSKNHRTMSTVFDMIAKLQDAANSDYRSPRIRVVKRLFKWPAGTEVFETCELEEGDTEELVYSDTRPLKRSSVERAIERNGYYGGQAKLSRNSYNSRGSTKTSPVLRSNGSMHSMNTPINIKVTSNTVPDSNCSLFINPRTTQDFQAILDNVTEMLKMKDPPCLALYPVRQPKTRVDSMSSFKQLNLKTNVEFIACGSEGPPKDSHSPVRNGRYKNGMSNGYTRQSNNFKDNKGRSYQRHNENRRSQNDDDHSPTRRSPRRDNNRDRAHGSPGYDKASPRRPEEQNGHAHYNDNGYEDNRYGQNKRNHDNEHDDDRSEPSRGNTPSEEEMNKRINDMEDLPNNLDKDVDF